MTYIFATIRLFQELAPADLEPLEQVATVRTYDAGQVIMLEGELNTPVFFVLEGQVRGFRVNPDGREQTIVRLQAGDVFNVPTAFDVKGAAPATAVAQEPSRLILIDQTDFRRVTSQNPQLALIVLQELSNKLKHLVNLTYNLSLRNVRSRLAHFILTHMDDTPTATQWTHEAIAAQIGTVREVVTRNLRKFVTEELIAIADNSIVICDRDRLEILADS